MSVTTERAVRDDLVATEPDPGEETRRPRRGRALLAAALVAVIVVGAGLLAWMSVSDRTGADGGLTLPDEREQATLWQTSLKDFVNQQTLKFILGQRPLSQWDAYLSELKAHNSEQYVSLVNKAYQDFKKNHG